MKILTIGDVVGRPGRRALRTLLPALRCELELDLVVANGENAAGGRGLTIGTAEEMFAAGVDIITSGNHIWDEPEILTYLSEGMPIIRPLNYPPGTPGEGLYTCGQVTVVNAIGRTFMGNFDCPFRTIDCALASVSTPIVIVDFHGEATSEKVALGWYLDGRVSAVIGTHTHVPTADPRILPKGTAYVTDVGMVGPRDSVIGMEVGPVLHRFLTQLPTRFGPARGPVVFNSVLIEIDESTGKAVNICRIDRELE